MPAKTTKKEPEAEIVPDLSKTTLNTSDAYSQIVKNIKDPPETSVVLTITPPDATAILDRHNTKNRPEKPAAIRDYITDIATDNWAVTGDTIKFAPCGRLLDGQNRLTACVRSDKSIRTHVVFGIPEEHFQRIDVGRRRTPPDILHIAGYTDVNRLASAIRHALILDANNDTNQSKQFRPENLLDAIQNDYSDLLDYMKDALALYKTTKHPPGEAAALLRKMNRIDPDAAKDFYDAWRYGRAEGRADAVLKMLEFLQQMKTEVAGGIPARTRVAVVITAWNGLRQDKRLNQASFRNAIKRRDGYPAMDGDPKK